ncbi:hypothetical protein vseg_018208 [Gypsophila vaccaria]
MKSCELCGSPARIYCDSDRASLCWTCDFKVHGANFLVARHSRNLLCKSCQSPTPWSATGPKLGPTVSLCVSCSSAGAVLSEDRESHYGDEIDLVPSDVGTDSVNDDSQDDDSEDGDSEDGDGEEEEEGDNQVVPWSSMPPELSSSSDRRYHGNVSRLMKRSEGDHPAVD